MITPHDTGTPVVKRVLDRIKGEGLSPRPRWEFIFKNYAFWILGAFAVALGAFAFAAALFELENASWRFYVATHQDFITFFLSVAPFLWVVALALFVLLGYVNIRRTKRGYRYPLAVIAFGAILTSIALGTGLYAAGFGAEIEEALGDHPPFYRPILAEEHDWWMAPGKGLLGGTVVSVASSTGSFVVRDFGGAFWTVDASDLRGNDLITLSRGGQVRVVGTPVTGSSTVFHACFLFPWKVYGLLSEGVPPPPLFVPGGDDETTTSSPRSEICKGIRPYTELRMLDEKGI